MLDTAGLQKLVHGRAVGHLRENLEVSPLCNDRYLNGSGHIQVEIRPGTVFAVHTLLAGHHRGSCGIIVV